MRLRGYDYAQPVAYFVTVCTQDRVCLLGEVVDGRMRLSRFGRVVLECWADITRHFPGVNVDLHVVMPNHLHGIRAIAHPGRGTACRSPTATEAFGRPSPNSIPTVVRSFKSAATRRSNIVRETPGESVWQRSYYERVIRNEEELNAVRQYILDNPAKWQEDADNPANLTRV